jgi:hypothetical protein
MKNTIKELLKKQRAAEKVVTNYKEAVEALQEVCEHDWQYEGHGHNDSLYICNICNKEEWR